MRPIATDVARSVVCVSVCVVVTRMYQYSDSAKKRLNGSRWSFGADSCGSKEPSIRYGSRSAESIRSRDGWQVGDAAYCQIL